MSSQFKSEKDRARLQSNEDSVARPQNSNFAPAASDDGRPNDRAENDLQLGPMSEETKARYSELLIALEQTITRAVERPDAAERAPRSTGTGAFERDAAGFPTDAPDRRMPPALSPFAPPRFRPLPPEHPVAQLRPLEPAPESLFPESPALEYDEKRRREDTITGLRLRTRPHPLAARQFESQARQHGGHGMLRRTAFAGLGTGAVILLGGMYLNYVGHAPNPASASTTPSLLQRVFNGAGDRQPAAPVARRMAVTDLSGPKNRPIALGVSVEAPPSGATVVVKGMPSGSRLTGGTSLGEGSWRISVRDMAHAVVIPPLDYVGAMNLAVDLRLADDTVADSDVLRLEWTGAVAEGVVPKAVKTTVIAAAANPPSAPAAAPAPAPPPVATDASGARTALAAVQTAAVQPNAAPVEPREARREPLVRALDRDEIATLMERGEGYLQNGDVAAARPLLRRAADAGHAQAAMVLGATYDPAALKELGAIGVAGNVATARLWYEKASQLGSAEAGRRLQALAQQ